MERFIFTAVTAYVGVVVAADRTLSLLPPYKWCRGLVLDSVLGPAEEFEYVSTTAPSSPPQTIS